MPLLLAESALTLNDFVQALLPWVVTLLSGTLGWVISELIKLKVWRGEIESRVQPDRELRSELPTVMAAMQNTNREIETLRRLVIGFHGDMGQLRGEISVNMKLMMSKLDACFRECPLRDRMEQISEDGKSRGAFHACQSPPPAMESPLRSESGESR